MLRIFNELRNYGMNSQLDLRRYEVRNDKTLNRNNKTGKTW